MRVSTYSRQYHAEHPSINADLPVSVRAPRVENLWRTYVHMPVKMVTSLVCGG